MLDVPFYELLDSGDLEGWHLRIRPESGGLGGKRFHWADLTWGRRVEVVPPLDIDVRKAGVKSDYDREIAAGAPVLSERAMHIVRSLAGNEVEFIPAQVENETAPYFVMNVFSLVKCLDEEKTQFVEKWTKESFRPDLEGEYKRLRGIVIHQPLAAGRNLFRLWGSPQHIIASRDIKTAFEREGLTGTCFKDVCSVEKR